jgi:hypothetical protein
MSQDIQFAKSVFGAPLRMRGHGLRERDLSGRFTIAESRRVGDAEIGEDPAAHDLRSHEEAVSHDADTIAELAQSDDGFNRAGNAQQRAGDRTPPQPAPDRACRQSSHHPPRSLH